MASAECTEGHRPGTDRQPATTALDESGDELDTSPETESIGQWSRPRWTSVIDRIFLFVRSSNTSTIWAPSRSPFW